MLRLLGSVSVQCRCMISLRSVRREFLYNLAALSGCVLLDNDVRSNVAAAKRNRPVQRHGNETRAEQNATENNATSSKPNLGHTIRDCVMQRS